MQTSVRYSPRAAQAIGLLKASINDIDIYVEDTTNRNMWTSFIRKHLPANLKLTSVTMLGGRDVVVQACRLNQKRGARPELYIIDSDLDILLGLPKQRLAKLHQISAYCIENLLLNDLAIADVGTTFQTEMEIHDAIKLFCPSRFISENEKALRFLFVAYAVASRLTPHQETVGYHCNNFYQDSATGVKFCPKKSFARAMSILRQARSQNANEFFRVYSLVKRNARKHRLIDYCSGKDYLLPPIHIAMCKVFGFKGNPDQLKVSLAKSNYVKTNRHLAAAISRALLAA